GTDVNLSWSSVADASSYGIEVATDSAFANVVDMASGLTANSYQVTGLDPNAVYYWRVTADNLCGGTPSVVSSFVVADQVCSSPAVAIPDNSTTGVSDVIHVDNSNPLNGLRVKLGATHSWVGDLSFTLAHDSTSVGLVSRPGTSASNTFGCGGSNVDVVLDDAAATSVQDQCNGSSPAIAGDQQPYEPLAGFDGQSIAGDWTLTATDSAFGDTGTLDQWCLVTDDGASFYTVGGSVSGMDSGKQLTLQLNTGNDMVVAHNGGFEFPLPMSSSDPYAVTVLTPPPGQSCVVSSGSGNVATANVTDVSVVCAPVVDEIFADGFEGAPL
ncbi:MAG: proprotein convertase P-domain-containing protein, partial [Rhodanobacteraceae bacterium]